MRPPALRRAAACGNGPGLFGRRRRVSGALPGPAPSLAIIPIIIPAAPACAACRCAGSSTSLLHRSIVYGRLPINPGSRSLVRRGRIGHVGCRAASSHAAGVEGSLRDRGNPAARPCARAHACLGHPQGAAGSARTVHAARGGAHLADPRRRGAGPRHGGRRELQRHLGGARPAGLGSRRPQASVSHRGLRRGRRGLGGRRQGQALEGGRRGHRPLQSGRRRRRGLQRRRPDAVALATHLGLRDPGRLVRPVLPRAIAPAHGQAQAPRPGRKRPATR